MSDYEPLDFSDISPIEIPVTGPDQRSYVLKEASGEAAAKYRNAILGCTRLSPEGKVSSVQGVASVEALLVASCLYNDKGSLVQRSVIDKWPSRVVKKLFEKAKEISELDESPSDLGETIKLALSREDSPVDYSTFSAWVQTLDKKEFELLVKLFPQDTAKNEQSAMTDG